MKLAFLTLLLLYGCASLDNSECPINKDHPQYIQNAQLSFCKKVRPKLITCVNQDTKLMKSKGDVKLTISYKVKRDGHLKNLSVSSHEKIGKKVQSCFIKEAKKLSFEKNPDRGDYHLDFLFNISIGTK